MKLTIIQVAVLLTFCVVCASQTNSPSFLTATNEADLVRSIQINQQRSKAGLSPIPIQLSTEIESQPGNSEKSPPDGEKPVLVSLRFKNTPLPFVLEEYTSLTGTKVLVEEDLFIPVTLATQTPVTREAAAKQIEKTLLGMGITLEPVDKKTLRAKRQPEQKRHNTSLNPISGSSIKLPEKD